MAKPFDRSIHPVYQQQVILLIKRPPAQIPPEISTSSFLLPRNGNRPSRRKSSRGHIWFAVSKPDGFFPKLITMTWFQITPSIISSISFDLRWTSRDKFPLPSSSPHIQLFLFQPHRFYVWNIPIHLSPPIASFSINYLWLYTRSICQLTSVFFRDNQRHPSLAVN